MTTGVGVAWGSSCLAVATVSVVALPYWARLARVLASSLDSAWAFSLLGLAAYHAAYPAEETATELQRLLADRLRSIMSQVGTPDWIWF